MDDDVRELSRKCAEAIGYTEFRWHGDCSPGYEIATVKEIPNPYCPWKDSSQAFELLCWLAERGTVHFEFGFRFEFYPKDGEPALGYACTDAAELRLALMRAVCKVKEGM